jgi:hypothetical protein
MKKHSEASEITPESGGGGILNADHYDMNESGTLFEEAINQLRTLQTNMIAVLVRHVAAEFKAKSDSYKKERYVYTEVVKHVTGLPIIIIPLPLLV